MLSSYSESGSYGRLERCHSLDQRDRSPAFLVPNEGCIGPLNTVKSFPCEAPELMPTPSPTYAPNDNSDEYRWRGDDQLLSYR